MVYFNIKTQNLKSVNLKRVTYLQPIHLSLRFYLFIYQVKSKIPTFKLFKRRILKLNSKKLSFDLRPNDYILALLYNS